MRYPKVCIIVLNWNGVRDTLECLESISSLNYPNYEAIMVDNGSTDMSVEIVRNRYPGLTIIESDQNLGYTGGNNLGIQSAMKRMADYVWILNNDTILDRDCLKYMIEAAEIDPQVGLLSPIIFFNHQRDRIQSCGAFFNTKGDRFSEWSSYRKEQNTNLDEAAFVLYGTALLIKRDVIEKIGLFDETFFAYFEDFDYSLRAHKNNFRTMVVKSAKIYHKDASSTGGTDSPIKTYYYYRNLLLLYRKHFTGLVGLKLKYKQARLSFGASLSLRSRGKRLSAEACLDGIWDGLTGSAGRRKPGKEIPPSLKELFFTVYSYGQKLSNAFSKKKPLYYLE